MRLLRLRLHHFAGVREREVAFAPDGVTVVVGPNEVGKSTLLAALDLLLTTPDNSHSKEVRDVQPVGEDVGPSVEAELRLGPHHLTYRKQWLRAAETTLRLEGPEGAETLAGRQAHDRAQVLFQQHVDRVLWDALRLPQGQAIPLGPQDRLGFAQSPSLRRALDAAAGGGMGGGAEDAFFQAVAGERARYLTETGKPTGAYREAKQAAEAARGRAEALGERLAGIEALLTAIPRLRATMRSLEVERGQVAERLRGLRAQQAQLQAQAQEVERLREGRASAERARNDATARWAERLAQIASAQESQETLADLRRRLADGPDLEALRQARDGARQAQAAAENALAQAGTTRRQAQAVLDALRQQVALRELEGRLARAAALRQRLASAEGTLATTTMTAERLAALEAAQEEVGRAQARLEVGAAHLTLRAERPLDLRVAGAPVRLEPGEARLWTVSEGLEAVLPGVLAVRVEGGSAAAPLEAACHDARQTLGRLLAEAGVQTLAEAREALQRRGQAEADAASAREDLALLLGAETGEALRQRRDALAARVPAATEGGSETPSLEMAEASLQAAEEAERAAQVEVTRTQTAAAAATERCQEAELAAAQLQGEVLRAAEVAARAAERLGATRAALADAELREAVGQAEALWGQALAVEREAQAAFDRQDPERTRILLDNAEQVDRRLVAEWETTRLELAQTEGRLQAQASDGYEEEYQEAVRAAERALREAARQQRLADAADLLYRLLRERREQALRDYQEPYRRAIVEMGRIVWGPGFEVELDADLAIARRITGGEALEFRQLSTGTREQLAVIARLAAARLASADGVPVVLDDAFGYADPERLARIGALLGAVADRCQIIVLTCVPERYRGIGNARVLNLEASGPASPAAAVGSQVAAAADPGERAP